MYLVPVLWAGMVCFSTVVSYYLPVDFQLLTSGCTWIGKQTSDLVSSNC